MAILDSDDWLEPDYLDELYKNAKRLNADIIRCGYYEDYEDGRYRKISGSFQVDGMHGLLATVQYNLPVAQWAGLYKKEFLQLNCIRYVVSNFCEDVLFHLLDACYAERYIMLPNCLYHYIIRDHSESHRKTVSDTFVEGWKIFDIHIKHLLNEIMSCELLTDIEKNICMNHL